MSVIYENFNSYAHPKGWVIGESQHLERDDGGPDISYREFEIEGYVLSFNSKIQANDFDFHFNFADRYIPNVDPDGFRYRRTEFEGVLADPPANLTDARVDGKCHLRQFHCCQIELSAADRMRIEKSAGQPIKVKISGAILDCDIHPDLVEVPGALEEYSHCRFKTFDTSNRCGFVIVNSVETLGESSMKQLISFRVPLTRIHISLGCFLYHQPIDHSPPPSAPVEIRQMARVAMTMPARS